MLKSELVALGKQLRAQLAEGIEAVGKFEKSTQTLPGRIKLDFWRIKSIKRDIIPKLKATLPPESEQYKSVENMDAWREFEIWQDTAKLAELEYYNVLKPAAKRALGTRQRLQQIITKYDSLVNVL